MGKSLLKHKCTHKQKKKEKRKNAISKLWRKSKIVKFKYEYKTLIQEEHTLEYTFEIQNVKFANNLVETHLEGGSNF